MEARVKLRAEFIKFPLRLHISARPQDARSPGGQRLSVVGVGMSENAGAKRQRRTTQQPLIAVSWGAMCLQLRRRADFGRFQNPFAKRAGTSRGASRTTSLGILKRPQATFCNVL